MVQKTQCSSTGVTTGWLGPTRYAWPELVDLWHDCTTHLMTDGIPRDQMPIAGVFDVIHLWRRHRSSLTQYDALPFWQYEKSDANISHGQIPPKFCAQSDNDSVSSSEDDLETEHSQSGVDINASPEPSCEYSWPSDTIRYEALSITDRLSSGQLNGTSHIPTKAILKIDMRAIRPKQMGQHRVSTFRVLVHIMQETHREDFDSLSNTDGDYDFWAHVYMKLNEKWGIDSIYLLKKRFTWVLDYIRSGAMPQIAACIQDALRQIWSTAGTPLRLVKHLYNYDVPFAVGHFLNPDLCPRWVKLMLHHNDAMGKLLATLPDLYGIEVSSHELRHNYGILLANLWEEAFSQGLLQDQTSDPQPPATFEPPPGFDVARDLVRQSLLLKNAGTWAWLQLRNFIRLKKVETMIWLTASARYAQTLTRGIYSFDRFYAMNLELIPT